MNTRLLINTLAAVLCACSPELVPVAEEPKETEKEVQIGVDITIDGGTRGSVGAGESDIRNITVFQFRMDGALYRDYYFEGQSPAVNVSGKVHTEYRFCAVMNMGDRRGSLSDISGISDFKYSINSMGALDGERGLPMASPVQEVDFGDGAPHISMLFTRLVTCLDFRLRTDAVSAGAFTLKSVMVRQSSSSVRPFGQPSKALSVSGVFDGDRADASDIEILGQGGTVRLYCLENCQGDILQGNTDPRAKLPSAIGDLAQVCTYLEVKADYLKNDGTMSSANIYRMYLGKDNCSNFDLVRNTVNKVTLSLSDWTGADNYWKTEWDVTFAELPYVSIDVPDVEVGGTAQAYASASFSDGSVDSDPSHFEWICEGPVSVSSSGVVSGLGNGSYTLLARYLRAPVEASGFARSQEFAVCQFIFGGFYDVTGIDEDLSEEPGVRYEDGSVTVTVTDDFGYTVSCSCDFTVGILGRGSSARYVSFESGESHPGSAKIVNGGYVLQSVTTTHGDVYMAPGSDVPIYLKDMGSLISEEVGIAF